MQSLYVYVKYLIFYFIILLKYFSSMKLFDKQDLSIFDIFLHIHYGSLEISSRIYYLFVFSYLTY